MNGSEAPAPLDSGRPPEADLNFISILLWAVGGSLSFWGILSDGWGKSLVLIGIGMAISILGSQFGRRHAR